MNKISIIGNGPSIKNLKLYKLKNSFIIGTNNIIKKKEFLLNKNYFFCAYDEGLLKDETWIKKYFEFKGKSFLDFKYKNKTDYNFKKSFKNIKAEKLVKNFLKKFGDRRKAVGTIVVEMAIPIAIYLAKRHKIKEIYLYGCEFNYKLKNNKLSNKSYFYNSSKKVGFKHTLKSSEIWKKNNIIKFKKIKIFLLKEKIKIYDKTPKGSLNFLNKI